MKPKVAIEKVSTANFDQFIQLIERLAEYEKLDPPDGMAKKRLKKDTLRKDPPFEAYLGRINGKAVSHLIFFTTYSSFLALPTLYIEDIFVLNEHRRQGVGKEMFRFCVKKAKEKGCGRVEWCVLTWNEPAIRFYEKNGGTRLGWYFYRMTSGQIDDFLRKKA
jgi:GNAT superfamily N-acetyltransferase